MDRLFSAITWLVIAIPVAFAVGAVFAAKVGGLWIGAPMVIFLVAIYAFVGLWMRPTRFEVRDDELAIVFPLRTITKPLASIARAEGLDYSDFKRRYPRPLRIGAGGLWGGFGLLATQNGRVQFYISRLSDLTLIEWSDGQKPLLISPEGRREFLDLLRA